MPAAGMPQHEASGTAYLIVQSQSLVALDLAMAITEFDPAASVVTTASCADALPAIDGVRQIAVAFVDGGPCTFAASALAREVAQRGGRVVLMGRDAEDAGEGLGYPILERPFSGDHVAWHLQGAQH